MIGQWTKVIFEIEKAIRKKTGARGLRSIIEALLLKTMFKLPTMESVQNSVCEKDVIFIAFIVVSCICKWFVT